MDYAGQRQAPLVWCPLCLKGGYLEKLPFELYPSFFSWGVSSFALREHP